MDKKLKNIKSSVLFFLTHPHHSKDFVKPAPILDSSFTPFTHCLETKDPDLQISCICIYCCCDSSIGVCKLPTLVYISAIFLGARLYNYLLFLLPIKLFVDNDSLLAYNLGYLLSSSIYFPRLSFFCLVIQDSLFLFDLMIS